MPSTPTSTRNSVFKKRAKSFSGTQKQDKRRKSTGSVLLIETQRTSNSFNDLNLSPAGSNDVSAEHLQLVQSNQFILDDLDDFAEPDNWSAQLNSTFKIPPASTNSKYSPAHSSHIAQNGSASSSSDDPSFCCSTEISGDDHSDSDAGHGFEPDFETNDSEPSTGLVFKYRHMQVDRSLAEKYPKYKQFEEDKFFFSLPLLINSLKG